MNSSSALRFVCLLLLLIGLAPAAGASLAGQIEPIGPNTPSTVSQFINGDFEFGSEVGWWEYSIKDQPIIADHEDILFSAHSGKYFAWLGGIPDENALISQQVTVSPDKSILTYFHSVKSEESDCGYDTAYVYVEHEPLDSIDLCQKWVTVKWERQTLNLAEYAGQSVLIEFVIRTDSSNDSHWAIDDVAFEASSLAFVPMVGR